MRIWDLISHEAKVNLCIYQWNCHGTLLDLFVESQRPQSDLDILPENENLGKFMSERPHSPTKVN